MNPQKLAKWRRKIGDDPNEDATVFAEMISLLNMRRVFNGIREMIQENDALQRPSLFFDVWGRAYADSVLMHIRRLTWRNPDGVALTDVLDDLKDNNEMVTREWYVHEFSPSNPSTRHQEFMVSSTESTFDNHFSDQE